MNQRERFLAIAAGRKPDYVPIFGFNGAPGMSGVHKRGESLSVREYLAACGVALLLATASGDGMSGGAVVRPNAG